MPATPKLFFGKKKSVRIANENCFFPEITAGHKKELRGSKNEKKPAAANLAAAEERKLRQESEEKTRLIGEKTRKKKICEKEQTCVFDSLVFLQLMINKNRYSVTLINSYPFHSRGYLTPGPDPRAMFVSYLS